MKRKTHNYADPVNEAHIMCNLANDARIFVKNIPTTEENDAGYKEYGKINIGLIHEDNYEE